MWEVLLYKMQSLDQFYSVPQIGHGAIPYFKGTHQFGGSFLGGVMRFALPILKNLGRSLLSIAGDTVNDVVIKNKSLKKSLKQNASKELINNLNNPMGIFQTRKRKSTRKHGVTAKRKK